MATESDLRDLLRGSEPDGRNAIDLDAVLRRARARRRPRVIAAGAAGALALAGVFTPVVLLSQQYEQQQALMVAEDSAGAAAPAEDAALTGLRTAATLSVCGAPVTEGTSESGLVLEVSSVTAEAGSVSIPVEVTLRNDGPAPMVGITAAAPVIAFSGGGTVLWHTSAIQDASALRVDLAPGESMTYLTTFEPLVCTIDDEAAVSEGLSEGLPAAGPGSYRVSAAIDFVSDDGSLGTILVTGPSAPVELR